SFVKARLLQGWLIVVPVAAVVTALSTFLSAQATFISLLTNTGLGVLTAAADLAFVLGLFLLMPAFSEKSVRFMLNILIVIFVSIGLFVGSLFGLMRIFPDLEMDVGLLYVLLLQTALSWLVGIVFLSLGSKNLSRIE
ncbi:MAG: hypothetical protein GTO24_00600, partial [candidate division Zixibacteria bacterium]|nr:hypothetical protein [candidate division Zixibacteria bacterium]